MVAHLATAMIAMRENNLKIEGCYIGLADGTDFCVDDKPENIIGANDAGLRGICFGGDMRALRAALADAGVPVPRGTDVVS